jgi:aminoglycoside phosphotransferase (APT) family kinase protein
VRGPEELDLDALTPWFRAHIDDAGRGRLTASLIAGGRSNLTYIVGNGTREWVLRRPPLGHVVETAHDMRREYRVISGLRDSGVPVPIARAFCDDSEVIGAPFYVMDKVDGRVVRSRRERAKFSVDDAVRVSHDLVDVLARLHDTDYEAVGLGDFGRPDGFLARNVARWGKQWQANKTRELPALEELARRIHAALPESGSPSIVHGDYRLENTMLDPNDARIVAVLDWEMSTLGDPLTDLGLFLVYWEHWDNAESSSAPASADATAPPGFVNRDEIVERYVAATGRDVANLDFYVVFAFYKLAVVVEGINARFLMGKTVGEGFEQMGQKVTGLIDAAYTVADHSDIAALRG